MLEAIMGFKAESSLFLISSILVRHYVAFLWRQAALTAARRDASGGG